MSTLTLLNIGFILGFYVSQGNKLALREKDENFQVGIWPENCTDDGGISFLKFVPAFRKEVWPIYTQAPWPRSRQTK